MERAASRGQVVAFTFDECRRHADATRRDLLRITAVSPQFRSQLFDRLCAVPLGDEQSRALVGFARSDFIMTAGI